MLFRSLRRTRTWTLPTRTRAVLVAVGVAGTALVSTVAVPGTASSTTVGATAASSEVFKAGVNYTGSFPDPAIIKVGGKYVAYATTTASKTLPVMTSTDLLTWQPRFANSASAWDNEAMPNPATWARTKTTNRTFVPSWAPSVAQLPNKTFLLSYAPPRRSDGKRCISVATSLSAQGPFTDRSTAPIVCPSNQGAIDPFVYTRNGRVWLLWKTSGRRGIEPTKLWSRELNADITATRAPRFRTGTTPRLLLTTAQAWEGSIIENPALYYHAGRLYLFYSGNQWTTSKYAVGYAICTNPNGGCTRPASKPLLATGYGVAGPGGPAPFIGRFGEFLFGYAAWRTGNVNDGSPRRLHLARVGVNADGTLRLLHRSYRNPL